LGPRRGPKSALFWPYFRPLLGLFSGPSGARRAPEGPLTLPRLPFPGLRPGPQKRGPEGAPFWGSFWACFWLFLGLPACPVRAPHFPLSFGPSGAFGPRGALKGALLALFSPLFGLFWPGSWVFGFTARSLAPPFWGPPGLGPFWALFRLFFASFSCPCPPRPGPPFSPSLLVSGLRPGAGGRKRAPKWPKGPLWGPFGPPFGAL